MFDEAVTMMVPSRYLVQQPSTKRSRPKKHRSEKQETTVTSLEVKEVFNDRRNNTVTPPCIIPAPRASRGVSTKLDESCASSIPPPMKKSFSTGSVDVLLATTSIPTRRKARGRKSQRLPNGNLVSEFSKLLSDDVPVRDDSSVSGSFGNPQLELLFGVHGEDLEHAVFLSGATAPTQSVPTRSLSMESMPSLDGETTSTAASLTEPVTPSPSAARRASYRRDRLSSASMDRVDDHPLGNKANPWSPQSDGFFIETPERQNSVSPPGPVRPPLTRPRSSFRSNLTASLKTLKAAAQTISSLATTPPLNRPDDFLTRSIFSITPELTDDRRPPRSDQIPTPALRRYLNPDHRPLENHSPSDFHSFSDHPSSNPTDSSLGYPDRQPRFPASIQLQTYLPPLTRSSSGSASSPPRFGAPTQTNTHGALSLPPSVLNGGDTFIQTSAEDLAYNMQTSFYASPMPTRQREPRENADFLRILVCELEMRRHGKFAENGEGRACVWLPPRREVQPDPGYNALSRWQGWTADEL